MGNITSSKSKPLSTPKERNAHSGAIIKLNEFIDDLEGRDTRLERLNISSRYLQTIPNRIWCSSILDTARLVSLNLSMNKLEEFPMEILRFSNLTELSLQNNKFNDIPLAEITTQLPKLTDLDLSYNFIHSFGNIKEFGVLNDLKVLRLQFNKISNLPDSWRLKHLPSLKEFHIDSNSLSLLDSFFNKNDWMANHPLVILNISNNQITQLPYLANLPHVQHLAAYHNKIKGSIDNKAVMDSIKNMSQLVRLNLSNNQIEQLISIDDEINLVSLTSIDLSNNLIEDLPMALYKCNSLVELQVSENKLKSIDSSISQLDNLERLFIRDNRIPEIPPTIDSLTKLSILELRGNPILSIPEQLYEKMMSGNLIIQSSVPDLIIPYLYLGNVEAAKNHRFLENKGISAVLNMAASETYYELPKGITLKKIEALDTNLYKIENHFKDCYQFIDKYVSNQKPVLVHCVQGRSRSATVVIAYLMMSRKISFEEADRIVKLSRPIANPNISFKDKLKQLQQSIIT